MRDVIVVGSGKRLFEEGMGQVPLKLVESKTYDTGVLSLTYVPAPGFSGAASVVLQADDGYGLSEPTTLALNVIDDNANEGLQTSLIYSLAVVTTKT